MVAQLILLNLIQVVAVLLGDGSIVGLIQITAIAVPCQILGVAYVAAGGNALGVGVLIPAGNTCNRNDGLQALNAGGSQTKLGGTSVGNGRSYQPCRWTSLP